MQLVDKALVPSMPIGDLASEVDDCGEDPAEVCRWIELVRLSYAQIGLVV